MKNILQMIMQKVSNAIKAHFDKNPNDLIAISFGVFVLTFILLITPQIPQTSTSSFADQPVVEQESIQQVNTDLNDRSIKNDDKVVLKATLK